MAPGDRAQRFDELVVHAFVNEYPGSGSAVLTGVVIAGSGDRLGGRAQIDVIEDDCGRLPSELEVDVLQGR